MIRKPAWKPRHEFVKLHEDVRTGSRRERNSQQRFYEAQAGLHSIGGCLHFVVLPKRQGAPGRYTALISIPGPAHPAPRFVRFVRPKVLRQCAFDAENGRHAGVTPASNKTAPASVTAIAIAIDNTSAACAIRPTKLIRGLLCSGAVLSTGVLRLQLGDICISPGAAAAAVA